MKLSSINTISDIEFHQLEFLIKDDTWPLMLSRKNDITEFSAELFHEYFNEDDDSKSKRAHRVNSINNGSAFKEEISQTKTKQSEKREISKSILSFISLLKHSYL